MRAPPSPTAAGLRVKKRELAGVWLALAILASVAGLAYRSVDSASETLGWVEHASQVLQQVGEVSGAYARAASARRAYVVAGDTSQLGELTELDQRLDQAVAAARASVADNPGQSERLELLGRLIDQRMADLDASVARRRVGPPGVETAEGLALATRIRVVREELEGEENRLLSDRDARTRRDLAITKVAEIVGTLVSFGILLVAFLRLRSEVARRRASEQALLTSEGFLDSIVENLPDMIFVKDARELRFERINRAGEELLGLSRAELLGKNDHDFFPVPQAEAFQARDRETLQAAVAVDIPEEPVQTKTGERWLHTKKVPIVDAAGRPTHLLGISEDITDRRQAAAALRAAKDAAESANKELEAFSYSVAHDLRAPLRAIHGFSEALEEDCAAQLDGVGREYLGRVRGSARQMGELIDGLLGLSRLSRSELTREKVDLSEIVRRVDARLREAHPDRKVELRVQEPLVVDGDARLLTAAVDNLLGNAWKFTSKKPEARIEVGQRLEQGRPVYYVRDNGAGFDAAYAGKLFGAFQRLHTSSEFEGTGIGLATVQRIVRRHGGRIWAEGEVDRGAAFYFTL